MSTFLPKKRTSLYTRLVIPKGLRKAYFAGRREVWKSLGTADKAEADYQSLQWEALGRRLFKTLNRHGANMKKTQIEALISNWLDAALDEAEDARASHGHRTDDERESAYYGLSDAFDVAYEGLLSGDHQSVVGEADELLQAAGLPALDHRGADFARVCRRLLRAKTEYFRIEADRLDGTYQDTHVNRPAPAKEEKVIPPSLPFTAVLDKYMTVIPRPKRTATPLKAEFLRFVKVIGGDRPIGDITKADSVRYKEDLQVSRKLGLTTTIKHLSNASAFFQWAEVHGYALESSNPMKALAPSKRQAKKHALRRRPFTDEELVTVFGSDEFRRQRIERPERYWVCLLLLFQVCRREEAGQLYCKDIGETQGITCMTITDEEPDQTLKNEGSRRKVPIHSSLIRLGFLDYVATIKKAGHASEATGLKPRLFPQLTRKGNNGYADPVGKYFSRLVTAVGITDPRVVIHSLRHGGITKLHSAGTPVNLVETLVGHSAGNVHESYVHKDLLSMKTLGDALEKLTYPDVMKALG